MNCFHQTVRPLVAGLLLAAATAVSASAAGTISGTRTFATPEGKHATSRPASVRKSKEAFPVRLFSRDHAPRPAGIEKRLGRKNRAQRLPKCNEL